jgi:hypothetical protein
MKLIIVSVLLLNLINAEPYSKIMQEVEEWGGKLLILVTFTLSLVIPQGLIMDDTENIHLEDFYTPETVDLRSNAKKFVRNLSLVSIF